MLSGLAPTSLNKTAFKSTKTLNISFEQLPEHDFLSASPTTALIVRRMSTERARGEPTPSTKAASDALVEGLGGLLRAQLTVASGDVTKAAAATEAVARELECTRKDVGSINQYCNDCESKLAGTGGDASLFSALAAIDGCHQETKLLEEIIGQMEGHMAQLEERWGRLKR